ncbi:SEC12-like protein 1 [Nymphaea colorata]|nr:SEC12-like protein 1 [Nymphaea colorata]
MDGDGVHRGTVKCAAWIRRRNEVYALLAKSAHRSSPPVLQISSYDPNSLSLSPKGEYVCEDGDPICIAVHPSGDEIVCSMRNGVRLIEFSDVETGIKFVTKDFPVLQGVGLQKCLSFSTDGSKFASGGEDGHLRIFEWPSLNVLLDEPRAHKSFRDMDFSLGSEVLVSTSTDGHARIWNATDGVPLQSLTRVADEKLECCRFSKDGTKPFLYCTAQHGGKVLIVVWDVSTWNRLGHKSLSRKPISTFSISHDGKYLALGSHDGDIGIVDVKKMELIQWAKRVFLGTQISCLDFCPTERVILSASNGSEVTVTKLNIRDWKEWQIYLLLLGLFLASGVLFYAFFKNSDSFWNFPVRTTQHHRPSMGSFPGDSQSVDEL